MALGSASRVAPANEGRMQSYVRPRGASTQWPGSVRSAPSGVDYYTLTALVASNVAPAGQGLFVNAVNDQGEIVGTANFPGDNYPGVSFAFLWKDGKFTQLLPRDGVPLRGPATSTITGAYDINNRGDIVGEAGGKDNILPTPVLWHGGGAPVDLGVLTKCPLNNMGDADAINEAGDIVGEALTGPEDCSRSGSEDAFFKPAGQPMQDIATITDQAARGMDVNSRGQALVCFNSPTSGCASEELWSGGHAIQLPFASASLGHDQINDNGVVVGTLTGRPVYTRGAGLTDLRLPPKFTGGSALSIDDQGDVVGTVTGPNGTQAALWRDAVVPAGSKSTVMPINLQSLIPPSAHFIASVPFLINNVGQIVANGFGAKGFEVVLMTPHTCSPPPSVSNARRLEKVVDTCDLNISIDPAPSPMKGGRSYSPTESPHAGFVKKGLTDRGFRDTCVSGCANVLVTVTNFNDAGVEDADVNASVTHLGGSDIVNKAQGGGYLCDLGSTDNPGTGKCTTAVLHVKTDANGRVFLRYWAPAVENDASTQISVNAHKCLTWCPGAQGQRAESLTVQPHVTYEVPSLLLAADERAMLVHWHNSKVGITDHADLAAVDKMLKRVAATAQDPVVAAALRQLANGVPLFGPFADFGVMEWFGGKFGIVDTGLMELDSSVVADLILQYLKAPAAASPILTKLKKYLGLSDTYREQVPPMLDEYASWLGPATGSLKQFMTLKLEDASYCKEVECTNDVLGEHDNLYLAFSSADSPSHVFFEPEPLVVKSGYNPLDWIPDQCTGPTGCSDKP